jgi:hypothetical protein
MKTLLAAVASLLLLAGCSGPLLFAELEIPEFGITLPAQTFPASTSDPSYWCAPDRSDCITTDFVYDIGSEVDLLDEDAVEYELRLTGLAITLDTTAAGTDLRGVRSALIEVFPPNGDAAVAVASYVRSPANPAPTSLALAGDASIDLAPFVDAGQVHIRIKMSYDAPTPEFTADVRTVFYLRVKLDYGKALGI